jgi:hypothetical protein
LNRKVYTARVQAEFDALVREPSLGPLSRYDGIVGMHPSLESIFQFLDKFLNKTETAREDMDDLIKEADALAILVDGDVVKDVFFHVFG